MLKYLLKRLLYAALTILGVASVVFILQRITGDPISVLLPPEIATPEQKEELRAELGLNQPIYVQYMNFILDLVRGNLGYSYKQMTPALSLVLERLPATFLLAFAGMAIATLLGVGAGIIAAVKRDTLLDRSVMGLALLGQAMPVYWIGILMILLFSVHLNWLPAIGQGGLQSLIMPALTLGGYSAARIARLTRSSMLEVLRMDYIRTARGKGLRERPVIMKHSFRNALIPIVTILGIEFAGLMGGAVITEIVFAWPGVGRLAVDAIMGRDYPVVQAVVIVIAALFVLINLGVDLIYGYLDPRIRIRNASK